MNLDLLTREDLQIFKRELLEEIRQILQPHTEKKDWLKSSDVQKILDCSAGTLQNLRINGTLPFTKIGGTIYYAHNEVMKVLQANRRN
jgi:hypothetical protein